MRIIRPIVLADLLPGKLFRVADVTNNLTQPGMPEGMTDQEALSRLGAIANNVLDLCNKAESIDLYVTIRIVTEIPFPFGQFVYDLNLHDVKVNTLEVLERCGDSQLPKDFERFWKFFVDTESTLKKIPSL